jgi:hypothetical protein
VLRHRPLLAQARNDVAAYVTFRDRYRAMATSLRGTHEVDEAMP